MISETYRLYFIFVLLFFFILSLKSLDIVPDGQCCEDALGIRWGIFYGKSNLILTVLVLGQGLSLLWNIGGSIQWNMK